MRNYNLESLSPGHRSGRIEGAEEARSRISDAHIHSRKAIRHHKLEMIKYYAQALSVVLQLMAGEASSLYNRFLLQTWSIRDLVSHEHY